MTTYEANFTTGEYMRRIAKTRAEMALHGMDAIVVSDPSNMSWLSGYDGWSFYVFQAVILTHEGEPVWWGRGMDTLGARRTVFMEDECIVGYDDSYVQNLEKHPMLHLSELLKEMKLETARIGVEGGPAIYLNSQSKTLPALIDPIFRARLLVAVAPLLDLGVEAVVNLPSDDNYRLIGGYLAGRAGRNAPVTRSMRCRHWSGGFRSTRC